MISVRPPIYAEKIKSEILPIVFYGSALKKVDLNRRSWNEAGLCPFHADKNPGSFFVNLETGAFNCFSCGTKGSDIIAFTMAKYQINFVEALQMLSEEWGLQ